MKKILSIIAGAAVLVAAALFAWPRSTVPALLNAPAADGLPSAIPTQTVTLNDGDTFELTADFVQKKIGADTIGMLAYNQQIPGPLIKVKRGTTVNLKLTNRTNVKALLHAHGVRLDNRFDGTEEVQESIPIGGSFTYRVTFPDAGVYWYHPHIREDYAQELGLYGNFIVTPDTAGYWPPVNREEALMIDDILIENGAPPSFDATGANHTLMGRFGNTMLVNGETEYALVAKQGEVIRLFLTNAASARVFRVAIPGAKMKLVGGDNGAYERETFVDAILLSPSERVVVDAWFPAAGSYVMEHRTPKKTYRLATVTVSPEPVKESFAAEFNTLRENTDALTRIAALRPLFDKAPDKTVRLAVAMGGSMMMGGEHLMRGGGMMGNSAMRMNHGETQKIEWEDDMGMMNRNATTKTLEWRLIEDATGKKNDEIDWKFKTGDLIKVRMKNDKDGLHPMQHPIHFHGQRFLVTSVNGVPAKNLVWKDTVLVETGDAVDILVDMSNPGKWLAHCHIPEHLESKMMLRYTVGA